MGGRGHNAAAARLSSLDHQLLILLDTHRVLTTPQLVSLLCRPERTVDYRLSRLRGSRLIERTRPYAASGSAPYFWWLTRSGARLVEGTSPSPGKAQPNPLFLRHTAAIAGLYVALCDVGPSVGLSCHSWLRDEVAWEEWSDFGQRKHLRPDAYVEVALEVDGEGGVAGAFIEVDFATMDQQRLRAKVARHREYASDRAWWTRHYGCPPLLLLTTSEARVTRFLVNAEKDRPKKSLYADRDTPSYEELVAAAACVGTPEAALSAPVWRTQAADAPVTLHSLLSAEVRKYRRLVEDVRVRRTRKEHARRVHAVYDLAEDRDALADALRDKRAEGAAHHVFGFLDREPWAEAHLDLVTATHRWWVEDDGRSGWPPPPTDVVAGWRRVHRVLWADQAEKLLANADGIACDDPRLWRPAADLADGRLVGDWTLTRDEPVDRRRAEREAAGDYEARRSAAVDEMLRELPLYRRLRTSAATLASEYDARHLVVCRDCRVARHDDGRYHPRVDHCPLCGGHLVSTIEGAQVLPALSASLATIASELASAEGWR